MHIKAIITRDYERNIAAIPIQYLFEMKAIGAFSDIELLKKAIMTFLDNMEIPKYRDQLDE